MCGKSGCGKFDSLPTWFQQCGEKSFLEQYKMTTIRKHIMTITNYNDAEVPLSAPLLNMDIEQNWVGKYSNITHSLIANATDGISPFLVLDLT